MSTKITAAKAKEYIDNYRQGLPAGAIKSGWASRDFIDSLLTLAATENLDGIRVYLAKYTENDSLGRFAKGDVTMILVPTVGEEDIDEYHDYMKICPPHCAADIGD